MAATAPARSSLFARLSASRVATAGAFAISALAGAFLLFANRGTTFLIDDWAYLTSRVPDLNSTTLFASQNGNWATTQVFIYRALADIFGIGSYLPWRLTSLALHLGCCAIVYVLARRRIGPWWALIPLALVLVSRGWETLLWPFQIGQLLSILFGFGAFALLDRRDWKGDAGASALLVLCLASSSYGPPLVLAVAVELVLTRWRALWILVAPVAAYLWWQKKFNAALPAQGSFKLSDLHYTLSLTWDILPSGPAAVLGTSFAAGRLILIAVVGLTLLRIVLDRRLPARLLAFLAAYGAYWFLVAWARSESPDLGHSPRYVDLGVVLFVLVGVELFSGWQTERWPQWARWPERALQRRPALGPVLFVLVGLIAARGVILTADNIKFGAGTSFRVWGQRMLAQQAAFGVGRPALAPTAPFYIEASGYFGLALPVNVVEAMATRFGGQLYPSEASLRARSEDAREYADRALSNAETAVVVLPGPASPPPPGGGTVTVLAAVPRITTTPGCVSWSEAKQGNVTLAVPASGLQVFNRGGTGKDISVALRRWAERPLEPQPVVHPGSSAIIKPLPDRSQTPWRLEVYGAVVTVCSLTR